MIPPQRLSWLRSFSWFVLFLYIVSIFLVIPVFLSHIEFMSEIQWSIFDYEPEPIPVGVVQANLFFSFIIAMIATLLLFCMAKGILRGLRGNFDVDAIEKREKRSRYISIGFIVFGAIWCIFRSFPDLFRTEIYIFLGTSIVLFVFLFISQGIFLTISKTLMSRGFIEAKGLGRIATIPLKLFSTSWILVGYYFSRKIGSISRITLLLFGGLLLLFFIFSSMISAFELQSLTKHISVWKGRNLQYPSSTDNGSLNDHFNEYRSQIVDKYRFISIKYFHVCAIVQFIILTLASQIFLIGTTILIKELLIDESVSNFHDSLFFAFQMYLFVFISNLILLIASREVTKKKIIQRNKKLPIERLKEYAVFLFTGFAVVFLAVAPLFINFVDIFEEYYINRRFTLVLITSFLLLFFFVNFGIFHLTARFLSPYATQKSKSISRIALVPLTIFCISWIPTISCFYMEDSPTYTILTIYFAFLLIIMLTTSFICSSKMIRLIKRIQNNLESIDE